MCLFESLLILFIYSFVLLFHLFTKHNSQNLSLGTLYMVVKDKDNHYSSSEGDAHVSLTYRNITRSNSHE